ncbi:hypothetical protein DUNSADRAFT_3547 [Dunaliella salina]|uniref:Uncharacterized protein n=1 Tax=Dunaliella salina TaxID=3046 RepID=A0ABQ7H7X1_DUNSA|nr:hypothetical protein DUNSADRAFT_3547 [Dunaliella salina]|eukprot:KAF5842954.1 hypothetical protein DUNSADRAFT_3547 [Dunaliella salina]
MRACNVFFADGMPSSKAATVAAQHLGITSPKLVGLAFLCHSSARIHSVAHEPLGLMSQLLSCIDSSIDSRLDQILNSRDGCNERELDELAKLSNLMTKAVDKVVYTLKPDNQRSAIRALHVHVMCIMLQKRKGTFLQRHVFKKGKSNNCKSNQVTDKQFVGLS